MKIKISAIIPCYNNAEFISNAIRSILKQTVPVDEIIVIDDGSEDNIEHVLKPFTNQISYYRQENSGPSTARNLGIKEASHEWIAFLDADDQWVENKIEQQLHVLSKYPELRLIASDMDEIDSGHQVTSPSVLKQHNLLKQFQVNAGRPVKNALRKLVEKNFIPTGTVLIKRDVLLEVGLFKETIRFAEDLELWCRVAANYPITCLPIVHMHRYRHDNNATSQVSENMLKDLVSVHTLIYQQFAEQLRSHGLNPEQTMAQKWFDLGYWYRKNGEYSKARNAFLKSIQLKPSKTYILNILACFPIFNKLRN